MEKLDSSEPMKEELCLTPTIKGNTPGRPLFEYFKDKLPSDLPAAIYGRGLSCLGFARLIVGELGGPEKAKVYFVERPAEEDREESAHAFVVPSKAKREDLAYNNNLPMREDKHPLTVEEVLRDGNDITDLVFKLSWGEI